MTQSVRLERDYVNFFRFKIHLDPVPKPANSPIAKCGKISGQAFPNSAAGSLTVTIREAWP
jgi:hypothetical protein